MNVLGIETSCDETSAAIVVNGSKVLSNVIKSSLKEHSKYGGVIPEIASRRHLACINSIVKKALKDSNLKIKDIDAIAVTKSPGLIGSLLVGTSFANAISFALNKPLIDVDHIKAHLHANFLFSDKKNFKKPSLPAVGLIVSGGHTSLYKISALDKFKLLGQTLDDAAGEAFDKVARILELSYPGGPIIDKLAKTVKKTKIKFNCAKLSNTLNFSFSGIKTAVLYYKQKNKKALISEVAFAFQESVVSVLTSKCLSACKELKTKTLLVGGGVAANSRLRNKLTEECKKNNIKVYFPPLSLCADNAAMIAGLGYHLFKKGKKNAR
ncbi:MAG: tRNA (adenosine(37)-N6)-threonylcarbamoyltransferase complex transferase subunit TsaD [Candidatus Zapsychrus exili]|nr:tRNA (adenosine(37)-N6)-threonylcarbamoyltransferase complex transferase subunit TsaD [Candidatus Zapsychrus exili]